MADEKLTDTEIRKRRAAERRARILALSTERMAVVEGLADSKLVRSEVVDAAPAPELPESSSTAEPVKAPSSFVEYDRLRRRCDAAYLLLLMALWIAVGLSGGLISSVQLVLVQAIAAILFAVISQVSVSHIQSNVHLGSMEGFLSAAEILVRSQRFVRDVINGLSVATFIYVLHGQYVFWQACSSNFIDECPM